MSLKEKMKKFRQRWDIPEAAANPEEEFIKFKKRVLNFMGDIDQHLTDDSIEEFCQCLGIIQEKPDDLDLGIYRGLNIIRTLNEENSPIKFYELLEIIFSLDIRSSSGYGGQVTYSRNLLIRKLLQSLEFSNINLAVKKLEDGEIVFYPKGEEMLDEDLVNKVMDLLDEKSNNHFIDALKFYQSKKYVKSAESLRRTLEEFLRFKFGNKKGLDQNKTELGKVLKSKAADTQIRNIIAQILGYLDQYFNENSKHNDGELDDAENEFLIYQTGLLLRYINQVI